jgi:hypothetical protein
LESGDHPLSRDFSDGQQPSAPHSRTCRSRQSDEVIDELHKEGLLTLRVAANLFTQMPKQKLEGFRR